MSQHLANLKLILANPILFDPIIGTWIASLGSAIHAPITQYYYVAVGATEVDVGNLNTVSILGSLLFAPVVGLLIDNGYTTDGTLIFMFLCTLGCFFRGIAWSVTALYVSLFIVGIGANLWNIVLAFLSMEAPPSSRSMWVSGYLGQQRLIRLLGKLLYPIVNFCVIWATGVTTDLTRYQYLISICTLFCGYGLIRIIIFRFSHSLHRRVSQSEGDTQASPRSGTDNSADRMFPWIEMIGISSIIFGQECYRTCLAIFWPLYVRNQFGWTSEQFGWVLGFESVMGFLGMSSHPILERKLGQNTTTNLVVLLSCVSGFVAFTTGWQSREADQTIHILSVGLLAASLGSSESCLICMATHQLPKRVQGKLFSGLNIIKSAGAIFGGSVGGIIFAKSESLLFMYNSISAFASFVVLCLLQQYYRVLEANDNGDVDSSTEERVELVVVGSPRSTSMSPRRDD